MARAKGFNSTTARIAALETGQPRRHPPCDRCGDGRGDAFASRRWSTSLYPLRSAGVSDETSRYMVLLDRPQPDERSSTRLPPTIGHAVERATGHQMCRTPIAGHRHDRPDLDWATWQPHNEVRCALCEQAVRATTLRP